jgi:hypothetical protein
MGTLSLFSDQLRRPGRWTALALLAALGNGGVVRGGVPAALPLASRVRVPVSLRLSGDGIRVFVANRRSGTLSIIDPGHARFSTWLRILARTKAVDLVRRQRWTSFGRCGDTVLSSLTSDRNDDPVILFEQAATQDEFRNVLRDLARELPRRTDWIPCVSAR